LQNEYSQVNLQADVKTSACFVILLRHCEGGVRMPEAIPYKNAVSNTVREIASPLGFDTPFAKTAQGYSTSGARNDEEEKCVIHTVRLK